MGSTYADAFEPASLRQACTDCGIYELCLPAGIAGEDLRRLDSILRDRRPVETGHALFHAGSPCNALHMVRSGSLMSVLTTAMGDSQVIGFHLPGEIVGLDGIGTLVHGCTTVALERSRVCELPLPRLNELAGKVPAVRESLNRLVSRELAGEHAHIALMGRRLAHERFAAFLLSLSLRYQRLHRDPNVLRLGMTRNDIASFLGLAVETVSRLFTRFHDLGMLRVQRRVVRILDPAGLEAICMGTQPEDVEQADIRQAGGAGLS
ncbi:MAG TPA: helix-turn-helix domain-containing protein [Xanthomonadaceae bacterium]|nr:helix-turn-helix domain-containing protein [Xanthomonadaceae bacterium]